LQESLERVFQQSSKQKINLALANEKGIGRVTSLLTFKIAFLSRVADQDFFVFFEQQGFLQRECSCQEN
jgi:hypothetical protein